MARTPVQTEADVLRWLAKEYDLAFTTLEDVEPDRQLLSLFPARILLKEELLPLRRAERHGRSRHQPALRHARSGRAEEHDRPEPQAGPGHRGSHPAGDEEAAGRRRRHHRHAGEEASFQVVDENPEEDTNLDSAAEDASIIRFVNQVLRDAIELRASDIHLEPFEDEFRIRYRIDGVLQEVPVPAQIKRFQPAIVSRVKILSHLNIAEKRLPQDGRIKIRIDDSEVDIRVSVIPMLHGEAVVMRLLRQNATLLRHG